MTTALSILDLVPRGTGVSSAQALSHALALARLGERLGYTRLWYAEHHNMAGVLSTTPELLISAAAREMQVSRTTMWRLMKKHGITT